MSIHQTGGEILGQRILKPSSDHQAAVGVATRALAWTFGVVWLIGVILCAVMSRADLATTLMGFGMLAWGGIFAAPFIVIAGELIGWFACRAVGNSNIPATRMSLLLTHILIFSIAGWSILLALSGW